MPFLRMMAVSLTILSQASVCIKLHIVYVVSSPAVPSVLAGCGSREPEGQANRACG